MLAVTAPAVLLARLEKAVHLVGAACNQAFTIAAAVFAAEAFAIRGGGAARHGARLLLLPPAVCDAMLEPCSCWGSASITLAPAMRTMPDATPTRSSTSLAALNVAHFGLATAMPDTQSSCLSSSRAIVKRADLFDTVLRAEAVFDST